MAGTGAQQDFPSTVRAETLGAGGGRETAVFGTGRDRRNGTRELLGLEGLVLVRYERAACWALSG